MSYMNVMNSLSATLPDMPCSRKDPSISFCGGASSVRRWSTKAFVIYETKLRVSRLEISGNWIKHKHNLRP